MTIVAPFKEGTVPGLHVPFKSSQYPYCYCSVKCIPAQPSGASEVYFTFCFWKEDYTISLPYTRTYVCMYMSVVCTCLWCAVLWWVVCGVCSSFAPPSTPTVVLSQLSTTQNKVQRRKKVAAERGKTLTYKCTHIRVHTHVHTHTNACDTRTWVCTHTRGHTIAHILPTHVPGATLHHMPLRATSNGALVVRSEMIPSTSPLLIQVCWPPLSRRR